MRKTMMIAAVIANALPTGAAATDLCDSAAVRAVPMMMENNPDLNRPELFDLAVARVAATWRRTMGVQGCGVFLSLPEDSARAIIASTARQR